ncbi:MAG: transglutaminase domain-containing protein [Phycisphaerae bacterium]
MSGFLAGLAVGMSQMLISTAAGGEFVVVPTKNPRYCPNELFPAFEDFHSPRMAQLRARYKLDDVVKGESDEWKRILLLRHWIASNIRIENDNPTPTKMDAFAIMDAALKGGGFHCAHTSIVQHAVLNSYGYVTRRLGCGPGTKERGGHHGVNEVWVNKFAKWVLIDAKYDLHFEKDGVPLSALEIRDEVWADGGKSVKACFGPDGKGPRNKFNDWEVSPETYRWCSWETSTNWFTHTPAARSSTLVMLDDQRFRENTWLRDGKPHWALKTPYLIATPNRSWIEWTPNVISSAVKLSGEKATVTLNSFTPNIRSYQVKAGDGQWTDCEDQVELPLKKEMNRFTFRAVNLFGVSGPPHEVRIEWRAEAR